MSEIVDHVARAIREHYADPRYSYGDPPPPEAIALVAIAAMREGLEDRIDALINRAVAASAEARDIWIDDLRALLKD